VKYLVAEDKRAPAHYAEEDGTAKCHCGVYDGRVAKREGRWALADATTRRVCGRCKTRHAQERAWLDKKDKFLNGREQSRKLQETTGYRRARGVLPQNDEPPEVTIRRARGE
jgi:hypothetical protein